MSRTSSASTRVDRSGFERNAAAAPGAGGPARDVGCSDGSLTLPGTPGSRSLSECRPPLARAGRARARRPARPGWTTLQIYGPPPGIFRMPGEHCGVARRLCGRSSAGCGVLLRAPGPADGLLRRRWRGSWRRLGLGLVVADDAFQGADADHRAFPAAGHDGDWTKLHDRSPVSGSAQDRDRQHIPAPPLRLGAAFRNRGSGCPSPGGRSRARSRSSVPGPSSGSSSSGRQADAAGRSGSGIPEAENRGRSRFRGTGR